MSGGIDSEVRGTATDDQGTGPVPDLEISAGKVEQKSPIKKPQFVMPKISLSKIKVPKSQTHSPKVEADATIPKTEREGDDSVQIPDIERSHSERTEEGAQISIKLADVKIPSLEFSRIETRTSQTEMAVSSAKIDAALPPSEGSFQQVVLKSSSTDEDTIQKTGIKFTKGEGWFKMPKFRIPTFGRTSLKEKKGADIERTAEITIGKEGIPKVGDSVKSSDVSLPKIEGDISLSTEKPDRVNIPETYADIVKRGAEGQKMHTSEFFGVLHSEVKDFAGDINLPKSESDSVSKTEIGTTEMQFQKLEGSNGLKSPTLDHTETSARITAETVDKTQGGPEVNIKIPKLKIPRFTFQVLPIEADVSVSKVVTDPKGSKGGIQKAKSKILTLNEPDIKTAQMTTTVESSPSNAGQDIHWSYVEGQEVSEKVEPEHVAIERCEIYTTEILKESEILSSEVKTATLGFSLLKVKLPESHSNLEVKPKCADESFGAQKAGSAELKLSDKPHNETEDSNGEVSLPKLKPFAVEVKPSSKLEESLPDKSPEGITAGPLSKDEDVAEALEDEEKDITNEKEKTDSKRSPGRFKFWLPSIGFSSSGDETSTDSKTEVKKSVPEDVKPADTSDNDSSKQTEKTGWFKFPKLGFTSPSKKAKTVDKEEMGHKEGRISDEDSPSDKPDIFFDAQESLSPKETMEGEKVEIDGASSNVPVSRTIVTSSARTELILLEEEKDSQANIPGDTTK
uniref:Protein AHNAK2 n=1 Tax=Otus sunia TaxID=257818 RepID=A0A8C8BFI1_9STRI